MEMVELRVAVEKLKANNELINHYPQCSYCGGNIEESSIVIQFHVDKSVYTIHSSNQYTCWSHFRKIAVRNLISKVFNVSRRTAYRDLEAVNASNQ